MKLNFFTILIVLFVLISGITLPGFANYFYQQGSGHTFFEIMDAEGLDWDNMTPDQRAPYQIKAFAKGRECAFFMTLGQHIPMYAFIFIIIGLLNHKISLKQRKILWFSFWGVWILGIFSFAVGSGYWGQAPQLPFSLAPAVLIYTTVAILCGIILGVGRFIRKIITK